MAKQEKAVATSAGLPANISSMRQALAASQQAAGAASGNDLYLKFAKGDWVFGAEENEVEDDVKLAVHPMGFMHGLTCWGNEKTPKEGKNLGEVMVPATQPMPLEADQPEIEDGTWSAAIGVRLAVISGEDKGTQLLFKSNSYGARKMYASLLEDLMKQLDDDPEHPVAVITVYSDSYKHDKFGKVFTPEYELVEWVGMDAAPGDAAEEEEPAGETAEEPPEQEEEEKPKRRRRRKAS